MSLKLSISQERLDEIIHTELARGMRVLQLYPIVVLKSPAYCKLPDQDPRNIDLDYQRMIIETEYDIEASYSIELRDVTMAFPIRVIVYGALHENPFVHPGGGPVLNRPVGPPSQIVVKLPLAIFLNLDVDENGEWQGSIDWDGLVLDESMITFEN